MVAGDCERVTREQKDRKAQHLAAGPSRDPPAERADRAGDGPAAGRLAAGEVVACGRCRPLPAASRAVRTQRGRRLSERRSTSKAPTARRSRAGSLSNASTTSHHVSPCVVLREDGNFVDLTGTSDQRAPTRQNGRYPVPPIPGLRLYMWLPHLPVGGSGRVRVEHHL